MYSLFSRVMYSESNSRVYASIGLWSFGNCAMLLSGEVTGLGAKGVSDILGLLFLAPKPFLSTPNGTLTPLPVYAIAAPGPPSSISLMNDVSSLMQLDFDGAGSAMG
jgi:hypothetical protein